MTWFKKKSKDKPKKNKDDEIFEDTNASAAPEDIFGDIGLDSTSSASNISNDDQELPSDGSIKIAYDADGNGYYVSHNNEDDSYFDPYSNEPIDISNLYDADGNPFSFVDNNSSSGEYWEQFVGVDGYGHYDDNNEWQWSGYFDDDKQWHSYDEKSDEESLEEPVQEEVTSDEPIVEEVLEQPSEEEVNFDDASQEELVAEELTEQPIEAQLEEPVQEEVTSDEPVIDEVVEQPSEEEVHFDDASQEELVVEDIVEQPTEAQLEEPVQEEVVAQEPIVEPEIEAESIVEELTEQPIEAQLEEPVQEEVTSDEPIIDEVVEQPSEEEVNFDDASQEELVAEDMVEQPIEAQLEEPIQEEVVDNIVAEQPIQKIDDEQMIEVQPVVLQNQKFEIMPNDATTAIIGDFDELSNTLSLANDNVSENSTYQQPSLVQQENVPETFSEPKLNLVFSEVNQQQMPIVQNVPLVKEEKPEPITIEQNLELGIQYPSDVFLSIPKDEPKVNTYKNEEVVVIKESSIGVKESPIEEKIHIKEAIQVQDEPELITIPIEYVTPEVKQVEEAIVTPKFDVKPMMDNNTFKPLMHQDNVIPKVDLVVDSEEKDNVVDTKVILEEDSNKNKGIFNTKSNMKPKPSSFDSCCSECRSQAAKKVKPPVMSSKDYAQGFNHNKKSINDNVNRQDFAIPSEEKIMINNMNVELPFSNLDLENNCDDASSCRMNDFNYESMKLEQEEVPKKTLLSNNDHEKFDITASNILSGINPIDLSEEDLFGLQNYDETIKLSLSKIFDFLTKSRQKSSATYKRISQELKQEIVNVIRLLERSKVEYRDNEKQISMKRNELIRALSVVTSNFANEYRQQANGRDFDKLQNLEDYNKQLLLLIRDNEKRLQVLQTNLSNVRRHYEKGIARISNDFSKMQRLVSSLSASTQSNVGLLESSFNSMREDHYKYQNMFNEFDSFEYDPLKNRSNGLIPTQSSYSKNNISDLNSFNEFDSIYGSNNSSLMNDDFLRSPSSSRFSSSNKWFDNDFESLKPDRTSDLTNFFDEEYDTKF
ncbi:hypothetical protein [Mycoplasmoides alvi]|uniref:hypothetical protein n=1 Tax=Mycoplasmoides alvi TaxID=78580 RepID=UPI00051C77DE|nr:hypothetical protein [Mycoplasmoides alvi]